MKQFALQMSSGVSYFEQFTWDLEQRGVSNIDVPVLILGLDSETGTGGKRPRIRGVDTSAKMVRETAVEDE